LHSVTDLLNALAGISDYLEVFEVSNIIVL